jgi:excinuclease UvrABC ATPase subunit
MDSLFQISLHVKMPSGTVILVKHDMEVIAQSDWAIDIGPGAGEEADRS